MNDKEEQKTDDAVEQLSIESGVVQTTEQLVGAASEGLTPEPAMTEQAMTEQAMTEQAVTEHAVTEHAMNEHAMNEHAMNEHAMNEHTFMPADTLPGQIFTARRAELRWSLDEAAERLKLTHRQVSALEANDFAALPGMASARGFIRSYAKALGLDPEPLLGMLANEPNPAHGPMILRRQLPTNGFPGRRSSPPSRRTKWQRRILLALAFLGAGFAAGFEAYRSQWFEMPSLDDVSVDISLPNFITLGSTPSELISQAVDTTKSVIGSDVQTEPAKTAVSASTLELKLSEDAWVEITTLSGNRIVSRLIKAGTTEAFEISEPSVLVVGNASAVQARLRGQLLNLKAVARDNVSKLSIK